MIVSRCLLSLALVLTPSLAIADERPQYVVISFDGALDVPQWERSRALARKTGAEFTYFLSCVYLLSRETRNVYQPPGMSAGRSNVGYAYSKDDVAARLGQVWNAHLEGHDIASHACGHFDGGKWSKADWLQEFAEFRKILVDSWKLNDIPGEPEGWRDFATRDIVGFRAPYLSASKQLYAALAADGFAYDASGVSRGPAQPDVEDSTLRFSLPMIPEGPKARPVIAMDYNLYVRHSGGKETADEDGAFEQRTLDAFNAAFEAQYRGERVPLQYGFHFTLMNGGAYWRALERFAEKVCVKAEVRCVSYRGYIDEAIRAEVPAGG
ncbi:polysaccharide deacetylase [Aquamicrobium sp. LC103]|uniref:polysaccharide deacetylase n=1 Tax=Aquamicrobium sp. LC103 TaxID=1120658 RepID=UPI00063E7694|nr:polysaccharide deacetylase [Aquamicrobium sp. LC103]TKT81091.1 polysaccharide deacetylase [Aquamicrobium sp. LC103]